MSLVTTPREIQLLIFGKLRVVDLVRLSETCHHLKDVARDPSLWKKLTLTYERIVNKNEACREHVSRCSSLREIVITGEEKVIRSDKIMSVLMEAKNTLTSINLSRTFSDLRHSFFKMLGEMTQLTHLALGELGLEPVGPGEISALARLTELKTLIVAGIDNTDIPTTAHVDLFCKLKKLEQVEMMEMKFPVVESLVHNNPNLHHLTIKILSSRSLILIADKCPQLTHIDISCSSVSDTSITKLVSSCPRLKYADFHCTNFDDTALARMSKNCPNLECLNIRGCKNVTEEALEGFKQNHPNVEIVLRSLFYDSLDWIASVDFDSEEDEEVL